MKQLDQEMLQDYVIEAQENLQELEPNLLLLEQEPENIPLLNDCFRNMHSIKGAAGYMGLERTSTLAHRMETLFDQVRQGKRHLDEGTMNLAFEALDRLKSLVADVAEKGRELTDISSMIARLEGLEDVPARQDRQEASPVEDSSENMGDDTIVEVDDDQELLCIYRDEMKNLYGELERLANSHDASLHAINGIVRDMIRVTNYVGDQDLMDALEAVAGSIDENATATADKLDVSDIIERIHMIIEEGLDICLESGLDTSESQDKIEEDDELYGIFLDFVAEVSGPLANVPSDPDEEWLEACSSAIERLKASAHYMDYGEVLAILDEWGERLAEILSESGNSGKLDTAPLRELWHRLLDLLPGLSAKLDAQGPEPGMVPKGMEKTSEEGPSVMELEEAIDDLFADVETGESDTPFASQVTSSPSKVHEARIDPSKSGEEIPPQPAIHGLHDNGSASQDAARKDSANSTRPRSASKDRSSRGSQLVRIDLNKVEGLLGDVGELVVLRSALVQLSQEIKGLYGQWLEGHILSSKELKPFKGIMVRLSEHTSALGRVVNQLQDGVMRMRMLPVSRLFNRYPRMVRDLALKLGKKVELDMEGLETNLDKRVIEQMADPLQHIIRNAIGHGIEPPELREKLGKPAAGRLRLSAHQEGNFVVISVMDDGKGLDRAAILEKAVKQGIINQNIGLSFTDEQVWNMIFLPGISTAREVSETAGRGVGMDVVRRNVERLGGTITLRSQQGQGTEILIRIPLTLAIIKALLVGIGEQVMAVPLASVKETFRIYPDEISSIEGYEIISVRQDTLPLIRLANVFRGTGASANPEKLFVVRVKQGDIEACLGVESLKGQQEVVIKPLAEYLTDQPGFSGATILGDGSIALILDIPVVLQRAKEFTLRRQQVMEQASMDLGQVASRLIH